MNKRQRDIEHLIASLGYSFKLVRITPHLVYDVTNEKGDTRRTSFSCSPSDGRRVAQAQKKQLRHLFDTVI